MQNILRKKTYFGLKYCIAFSTSRVIDQFDLTEGLSVEFESYLLFAYYAPKAMWNYAFSFFCANCSIVCVVYCVYCVYYVYYVYCEYYVFYVSSVYFVYYVYYGVLGHRTESFRSEPRIN